MRTELMFLGGKGAAGFIHLPSLGSCASPTSECSVRPRGDRQVLVSPGPALPSSLSPRSLPAPAVCPRVTVVPAPSLAALQ